jgi:outer membrane lipoprotein-sorting protein
MKTLPEFPRRARWAVPAGAVALVAAVTAGSMATAAAASPALAPRTPTELLTALAQAGPPPPLTGTVSETADFGIPQLPGAQNPTSVLSLLSGTHTIQLAYGGPGHARLALPFPLGETDLIRNGSTAWIWQSSTDSVERILLPAHPAAQPGPAASRSPTESPLTPQQAARKALAAVGPTTSVTVGPTTTIAGEDAYQLVIAPRDSRSLVGKVVIAVDAQHPGVPLQVQIFARGAASPAFDTGYTQISFSPPPASTFDFTPPAGATVHTVTPPAPQTGSTPAPQPSPPAGQSVVGTGWLSVAVLPASALSGLSGNAAGALGQAAQSASAGPGAGSGGVDSAAVLAALLKSAKQVSGTSWGSGRLLQTSLVSVLITSSHVFAGAVDPSVLYRAAAQVG